MRGPREQPHPSGEPARDLPADLVELEGRLRALSLDPPPARLRTRVLAAVRVAQRRPPAAAGPLRWTAMAAAACLVAWLNLVMALSLAEVPLPSGDQVAGAEVGAAAARIGDLLPDLSRAEAERQALLLQAAIHLRRAPGLGTHPDLRSRLSLGEKRPW